MVPNSDLNSTRDDWQWFHRSNPPEGEVMQVEVIGYEAKSTYHACRFIDGKWLDANTDEPLKEKWWGEVVRYRRWE